ncbi:MAG: hypothetical protein CMJ50_05560 [Planctomycetaceae bacterium]|jgi:MoxR-like ATPase|nr:hypothetical protein [Planctomycetaceae bacterium]
MSNLKAGRQAIDFVKFCYESDRPLLLSGKHGIGKSELIEQAAKELGIAFIVRDLSLMEPPDLIGLPKMSGRTTMYLPPDFLPKGGKGILAFEELNRCERYMRAPCLQLLTSRTLNDYVLPNGWLPAAAINPPDSEYEVLELDPALLSRFTITTLVSDVSEWLDWARDNDVHTGVIEYAENDSTIFDEPHSNPRAWKYVSDFLKTADNSDFPQSILRAAVQGLVGDKRGTAFLSTLKKIAKPLTTESVLASYLKHRAKVKEWVDAGKLDLVEATLLALQKHLQPKADYKSVKEDLKRWGNLAHFLSDLPPDLLRSAKSFFRERKYEFPQVQKTTKPRKAKRRVA